MPTARRLDEISYDEILELAAAGAQVMQLRSVELAKQYGVEFEVLSSLAPLPDEGGEERGTKVVAKLSPRNNRIVSGVALDSKVAHITLLGLPDKPGVAFKAFKALGDARINLDMIVQSAGTGCGNGPTADISFTCARDDLDTALEVCNRILPEFPGARVVYDTDVAKVSIVGSGVASNYGVAAKMFEALAEKDINIELITGSEIKISCLVRASRAMEAVRAVARQVPAGQAGADRGIVYSASGGGSRPGDPPLAACGRLRGVEPRSQELAGKCRNPRNGVQTRQHHGRWMTWANCSRPRPCWR